MPELTPFLWFNNQAEDAVRFYLSIFPNSRILSTLRYSDAGPGPKGSVMTIDFQLDGQQFTALNGGPVYQPTPAVSFVVHCTTQIEVDHYWNALSAGGKPNRCGWLTDKFGITWQIVPTTLLDLLHDKDPQKVLRVTKALFQMDKIDIAKLQQASHPT